MLDRVRIGLADHPQQPEEVALTLGLQTFTPPARVDKHSHACRFDTFHDKHFNHKAPLASFVNASLPAKQIALGVLHEGYAYTSESLDERVTDLTEQKEAAGEKAVYMIPDCSPDIKGRAIDAVLRVRAKFAGRIDIIPGAYPILGLKEFGSEREEHLLECIRKGAKFLVGLPERDARHDHPIGFRGHITRLLKMGFEEQLDEIQMHVDQTGRPTEDGLDQLIEAVRWMYTNNGIPVDKRPKVWAVHCISSSAYDEPRFWKQVDGLLENNIGIICCPHAAISMRQPRNYNGPIHNLLARVLEYAYAGIMIGLGSDNNRDLLMPLPESPLMQREYDLFASATRFYVKRVLDKLFGGIPLNQTDIDEIEACLKANYADWGWTLPNYRCV